MARLFVPAGIRILVKRSAGGVTQIEGITLSGGLYLFGEDNDRLDGQITLDPDEQASLMAIIEAAAGRHWQAMAAAYAATVGEPGATDVDVPPLADGGD